jgi:hypothetical protein
MTEERDNRFWMFDWLERTGITDVSEARKALNDKAAVKSLFQMAEANTKRRTGVSRAANSILAGAGLDLSSSLACRHLECRVAKVDDLFSRAWFYFDEVVVADSFTHPILRHENELGTEWGKEKFLGGVAALLTIQARGAQELVAFADKSFHKSIRDVRRGSQEEQDSLVSWLNEGATVRRRATRSPDRAVAAGLKKRDARIEHWFQHPESDVRIQVDVPRTVVQLGEPAVHQFVLGRVAQIHYGTLADDIRLSTNLHVPLAVTNRIHNRLCGSAHDISSDAVLFALELPILHNLSIDQVIALRSEEGESFDQLRAAFKAAIKARLANRDTVNVERIAIEIKEDLIVPQLNLISRRLKLAERTLGRKSAVAIGAGALTTIVGYLGGLGPLSLLAGAVVTALDKPAIDAYFDRREEIEMSDMFFLWTAADLHRSGKLKLDSPEDREVKG